jgi:hypothetical protein
VPVEYRVGQLFTIRDGRATRFDVFDSPADAFQAARPTSDDEPAS